MIKLKVLQITQSLGGGVQKYIIHLCNHLDRNRFSVTGCCSKESEHNKQPGDVPFPEAFHQAGVPYFVVPMQRRINPWWDFVSFLKVFQQLRHGDFDVVHAHSSKAGFLARVAARLVRVPVVIYSPHAFSFDGPQPIAKKFLYILFEKIASFFCDAIVADSPSEKELALKFKICPEKKIAIIPPSLDLAGYHLSITKEEKTESLKKLGIPLENKLITMIARLAPQKDPLTFIHAAALLTKFSPSVSFLLVGDGPLMNDCLQAVEKLGLHEKIRVLGWRRDYKTLLQMSDVFVNPSLWEGLPFILLEAMLYKKPVVAIKATGTIDVIKDGENGFLVPSRSPKLLAEKIKLVLDDPALASKLGAQAQKTVKNNFGADKTIPLIEKLYLQLFNKKANPSLQKAAKA